MVRILLADDHPIVREGLTRYWRPSLTLEIIAECANGEEVLRVATGLQPDDLLDLEMPIMDGVETVRRLLQSPHRPRVIIFTAFDDDERIIHALQAGADGYLLKDQPRNEIFRAIRVTIGRRLNSATSNRLQITPPCWSATQNTTHSEFSKHAPHRRINRARTRRSTPAGSGYAQQRDAAQLIISERTAKFHVSSIMSKLGANNRTEAVAISAQRGLIDL